MMSEISEKITLPDYDGGSLYNLAQTIMRGLDLRTTRPGIHDAKLNGKRISLVVIDGLGYNLGIKSGFIKPDDTFLTSVFPSITTTALATLMSGQLPGEHGILGGTTFLKRFGTIVNNFQYAPAYSNEKDILKHLYSMREAFGTEDIVSMAEKEGKRCAIISPQHTSNNELSTITGSTKGDHFYFYTIWDALDIYRNVLGQNYDYVYLYIPYVDKVSHIYGPNSDVTLTAARQILSAVNEIALTEKSKYVTVITADHGHVEAGRHIKLGDNAEFVSSITMPPFGSTRSVFMSGSGRLVDVMTSSFQDLRVFDNSRQNMKALLGSSECLHKTSFDYIAVPSGPDSYFYPKTLDEGTVSDFKGRHGGLSTDEMLVPLIIVGE